MISPSKFQPQAGGDQTRSVECNTIKESPYDVTRWAEAALFLSNCTRQNETLGAANSCARGAPGGNDAVTDLGHRLALMGYPATVRHNEDSLSKSALQYIENHDHPRFICNFGLLEKDNPLLQEGDRTTWAKVQPYVIGLLTDKGIPLLWQGQELGENYYIPWEGWGRVMLYRPVRWDYFYDPIGKATIGLFRKLLALRRENAQFRQGEHYFYNHYDNYQSKKVLLFHRRDDSRFSLVALNFSDHPQWVPFTFPVAGDFVESLHGREDPGLNIGAVSAGETRWLEVSGNYGRIWTR